MPIFAGSNEAAQMAESIVHEVVTGTGRGKGSGRDLTVLFRMCLRVPEIVIMMIMLPPNVIVVDVPSETPFLL
ncbi:ABC transporter permease [Anopheles sinensis]|uniref:ABC transporter permease n=1 Tax=Anopheles sinensis TaxID=74873 RepID=A0A084VPZ7_ANOSI|nr:ABC transporter permease [Anopheles sinensis]